MEINDFEKRAREEKEEKMSFSERVYQIAKQIPAGKVTTYGQIAAKLGNPKAARAVGNALHNNPDPKTIPCYRVVNREGRVATNFGNGGWKGQKKRLKAEGMEFKDKVHVNLEKHLWKVF